MKDFIPHLLDVAMPDILPTVSEDTKDLIIENSGKIFTYWKEIVAAVSALFAAIVTVFKNIRQ